MTLINQSAEQYVAISSRVLQALMKEEEAFKGVKSQSLKMQPAQALIPLRLFEPETIEQFKAQGSSAKEIARMQAILDHPYRLVVQGAQTLETGQAVDNRILLFDALEHFYLEVGYVHETEEVIVMDSYYRHNETLSAEQKVQMEQVLVQLVTRVAVGITHYLHHEASNAVPVEMKAMKTAFLTQRQRQLKHVYKNRKLTIYQWVDVQFPAISTETTQVETQTDMTSEAKAEAPVLKVEANTAKAKVSKKKAVKEEVVLEILEDGTKIVQYERAGYWRTQKNKATGEEKKIWIEPKIMTRKVAAK